MNIPTLKQKILSALPQWVDSRIDLFVQDYPALTMVSAYLKRGAQNYLSLNTERIGSAFDHAKLFIADEKGNINLNTLFDDLKAMFDAMPVYPFDVPPIHGTIGKGEIKISIPDNLVCTILFGNLQAITIKSDDLLSLKDFIRGKDAVGK